MRKQINCCNLRLRNLTTEGGGQLDWRTAITPVNLFLSIHAEEEAEADNLYYDDIELGVRVGHRERRTGVIFCQVRAKDLAKVISGNHDYWRLVGTTIILCSCGEFVITVYRNPSAFKKDRAKEKYNRKHASACPCCQRYKSAA